MKTPTYAVYPPPMKGLPYLAVAFVDGETIAVPFGTAEAAAEHNRRIFGRPGVKH